MGPGRSVFMILTSICRRHSTRLLWLSHSYRDLCVPPRSTLDLFLFSYVGTLVPPYMNASQSPYSGIPEKIIRRLSSYPQGEVLDSHLEDLDSRGEGLEDNKYKTFLEILLPLGSSQIPSVLLQDSDVFYVLFGPFSG